MSKRKNDHNLSWPKGDDPTLHDRVATAAVAWLRQTYPNWRYLTTHARDVVLYQAVTRALVECGLEPYCEHTIPVAQTVRRRWQT